MKEITESMKLSENRNRILGHFGNEIDGYAIQNKPMLQSLMTVAICYLLL